MLCLQLAQSGSNNVTLLNVTRFLGGFYKCEVSADMPNFHTGIKTEYLTVFGKRPYWILSGFYFQYRNLG